MRITADAFISRDTQRSSVRLSPLASYARHKEPRSSTCTFTAIPKAAWPAAAMHSFVALLIEHARTIEASAAVCCFAPDVGCSAAVGWPAVCRCTSWDEAARPSVSLLIIAVEGRCCAAALRLAGGAARRRSGARSWFRPHRGPKRKDLEKNALEMRTFYGALTLIASISPELRCSVEWPSSPTRKFFDSRRLPKTSGVGLLCPVVLGAGTHTRFLAGTHIASSAQG